MREVYAVIYAYQQLAYLLPGIPNCHGPAEPARVEGYIIWKYDATCSDQGIPTGVAPNFGTKNHKIGHVGIKLVRSP